VVSDFSLIDAIESGIVKVPRVPVADDSMQGDEPTYRNLWIRIRDQLPKKGRGTERLAAEPHLPKELQGALHSLYTNYKKAHQLWQDNALAQLRGLTPPVFIVVCSNTNVSKLVYDYVAGWEKPVCDEMVVQAGALDIFRNDDGRGKWLSRPNTILVDSEQLESGEAMSVEFKQIAAREIEEFKADYKKRFPGRDAEELTDEDLLREVMNTVGKPGIASSASRCSLKAGTPIPSPTFSASAPLARSSCASRSSAAASAGAVIRSTATGTSSPNTPRSTACRSRSFPVLARARTQSPAPTRRAFAPSRSAMTAKWPSRGSLATATTSSTTT
jgi:hypothetical protein